MNAGVLCGANAVQGVTHDMVAVKTAKKTESAVDQRCGLRTAWSGPRHCALIQQSTLICKPTHTVRLVQSDAIERRLIHVTYPP